MKGIDISSHNGKVNFEQVKQDGIDFVIIRAGYGKSTTQKDTYFETNYENAVKSGLHVGAYWYSYANDENEALQEAKCFYEVIKGKKFDYPVFLDIEEKCSQKNADSIVSNFCQFLESKGYFVGIYASKSYFDNYISSKYKNSYAIWVAQWTGSCTYAGNYGLWQYSDKGKVNGVNGNVDLNECKYLYDIIIKSNHLNGYDKPEKQQNKITVLLNDNIIFEKYI